MSDITDRINRVTKEAIAELEAVKSPAQLEAWRIKYLGTKGIVKEMMQLLGKAPREEKPALGQQINTVKTDLTTRFEDRKATLSASDEGKDAIDVTEPGRRPAIGNKHILIKVADELTELFGRMGFTVATGPEVEDEFHNF